METRSIADLQVPPLCLGTMTFGTPVREAAAIEIVHRARAHDVNFIDTANMYEGYPATSVRPEGSPNRFSGRR